MAAPTQDFPSWLTPSVSIITDAAGVPVTTSTTVLFLPLTYYGPSIPLDADWTYGGLTSPASTATSATQTTPTSLSTSLTTTLATPTTSTLSNPSSVSSTFPTTSTTSSSSTSSPTISGTSGMGGHHITRGQLITIIVATILGVIFIFFLALCGYLCCKGRRKRQSKTRFSIITPIDEDYFVVGAGGHTPGEGSPRHSGEEADSFLQRSRQAGPSSQPMTQASGEMGSRPRTVSRVPPPPTGSLSSSGSSSTNTSGYGVLLDRPSLGLLPSTMEETERELTGQILTPEEMRRLDEESVLPQDQSGEYSGAYAYSQTPLVPPPRLVDPETASWRAVQDPRTPFTARHSHLSHSSSFPVDADEAATLLTARRVRVEDLGPRTASNSPTDETPPRVLGGLGLGGLANIGRLSWFRNMDSPRHSPSAPSFAPVPLSDLDLETGRAQLIPMLDTLRSRNLELGVGPDGNRPISSVSARSGTSGGTIYHDAHSSLPGTPLLSPLPRAMTPSEPLPSPQHLTARPSSTTMSPTPYDERSLGSATTLTPGTSNLGHTQPSDVDILDMPPAPSGLLPFASSTSSRDTTSSGGLGTHPYPPGLEMLSAPKVWTDLSSGTTVSPNSFVGTNFIDNNAGISIDVLEEEPPAAGQNWRFISSGFGEAGRRTTFGLPMYVHPPDLMSERGSLHSMRSHLSPTPRSTGSAAASRRELSGSIGSGSSRPSAHSAARSGSSGFSLAHSLAHSGSISSDGRKRYRGPVSPALSAFGHQARSSEPPLSPIVGSPPAARLNQNRSPHLMTREPSSPPSPSLHLRNAPWAAGLDRDWAPT